MEGIIYDWQTLYNGLVKAIALRLFVDITVEEMEIKYVISDRIPPVRICNDVGVRFYLDQKKFDIDFFIKHPLCITLKNTEASELTEYGVMVQQSDV